MANEATVTTVDPPNVYLGDGVYASFDGFQIWLAVGHHTRAVVALEPEVFANLIAYATKVGMIQPVVGGNEAA